MTNEAATTKAPAGLDPALSPTFNPDALAGQSLTIRVLEWPSGYVTLTITDKTGRQIAVVQSGPTAAKGPGLSEIEAREYAQALVYRFNSYDLLLDQLRRATFEDKHFEEVDEATPSKARIEAIADDLQAKIEQTKRDLVQARQDYLNEASYRELVAEHRDQLEQRLAEALTTIERLRDA